VTNLVVYIVRLVNVCRVLSPVEGTGNLEIERLATSDEEQKYADHIFTKQEHDPVDGLCLLEVLDDRFEPGILGVYNVEHQP
jgi:hypothetical protein